MKGLNGLLGFKVKSYFLAIKIVFVFEEDVFTTKQFRHCNIVNYLALLKFLKRIGLHQTHVDPRYFFGFKKCSFFKRNCNKVNKGQVLYV